MKCDLCDSILPDNLDKCPNCGANLYNKGRYLKPQTIEQLKIFCEEKSLSLHKMRFFIGENYKGARAFGIIILILMTLNGIAAIHMGTIHGTAAITIPATITIGIREVTGVTGTMILPIGIPTGNNSNGKRKER